MKILYVSTISNTVNAFLIPHIEMLIKEGHQVDVAYKIEQEPQRVIREMGCSIYELDFSRSIVKNNYIKLIDEIKLLVKENSYDIVHTHTPIASAIVRIACRNLNQVKVIYTAHGFHFYKGAPLKNWLLFYPAEIILSKYTDTLITINEEDYKRAQKFNAKNTYYVPGIGIDLEKYVSKNNNDINLLRKKLNLKVRDFILFSTGELNKNKNHEIVIRAISQLNNPSIHYIIAGQGPLKKYLNNLAIELKVDKQVHLLGYRDDIPKILSIADVFVFPSIREGLSVSLMEAMAVGLPVITSNIRGNNDLIDHEYGGYLIDNQDVDEYVGKIVDCYQNESNIDLFGSYNQKKILKYSIVNVIKLMKKIYKIK
ncbi:glycosyltransferase family 4 protein [Aerococcus urinaeequi]|uniref:glycosyltransferase family 4 protein n=1 Tax=Aerococcus urinaeequi TaxID=51665 RepID=UPI000845F7E5|nr:glycosyltransferase family 4 protein [Aerococcus urinaeequi]